MSIEYLKKIIIPPDLPNEAPSEIVLKDFEVEIALLPEDYKDFIKTYGSGSIDNFMWICNPAANNPFLNLYIQIKAYLNSLQRVYGIGTVLDQYKLYPESNGLLPFGGNDNGDLLLWKTHGHPNEWNIVVLESRMGEVEEFNENMACFLCSILSRKKTCKIFPDDFPSSAPFFKPI